MGPRLFSCSTNTLSMAAAFLFFSVAKPLYSSTAEGNTSEEASSLIGDNLGHTTPVRTECGMFVMYCMQCCMSVSAVL